MDLDNLRKDLRKIAEPKRAKVLQGFFKTGKGEYGEGDVFLGITVPKLRKVAAKFKDLDLVSVQNLLKSKIHEERLTALLILVNKFNAGSDLEKNKIYSFYLQNIKYINNWDLVDLSAHQIIGKYLLDISFSSRGPAARQPQAFPTRLTRRGPPLGAPRLASPLGALANLAKSKNLWERRIAIIATFAFIKNNQFNKTLEIAKILLQDKHDLIQKAVGWMLREVGKRDLKTEIGFLDQHFKKMPRTMLRYAIEKSPEKIRLNYLRGKICRAGFCISS